MHSGMLFYDGKQDRTFAEKVAKASFYFKKKYGRMPEVCIVNPEDWHKLPVEAPDKIQVLRSTLIVRTWDKMLAKSFGLCLIGEKMESAKPQTPRAETPADAFIRHARKTKVTT